MSDPDIEITNQRDFTFTMDGYDGRLTHTEWTDDEDTWDVYLTFGDDPMVWLTAECALDERPTDAAISGLIADFNKTVRAYADILRSLANGETVSYEMGRENSRARGLRVITRMNADSFHLVITSARNGAIVHSAEHGADQIAFGLARLAAEGLISGRV